MKPAAATPDRRQRPQQHHRSSAMTRTPGMRRGARRVAASRHLPSLSTAGKASARQCSAASMQEERHEADGVHRHQSGHLSASLTPSGRPTEHHAIRPDQHRHQELERVHVEQHNEQQQAIQPDRDAIVDAVAPEEVVMLLPDHQEDRERGRERRQRADAVHHVRRRCAAPRATPPAASARSRRRHR